MGKQTEGTPLSTENVASRYVLDATPAEHERLTAAARRFRGRVRELCSRAGIGTGAHVIDVGCGPVGALLDLAEIVGPAGRVVGVDISPEAVDTARALTVQNGLTNVIVVPGDINTMAVEPLLADGPFDAAHMRLFLIHQADPVAALRRVATLLKPGGRIIANELVDDPDFPRSDRPMPTRRAWELLHAAMRRGGASPDAARHLLRLCEAAGLRVLDARGSFSLRRAGPAQIDIETTKATLMSARRSIVEFGLATDGEIDALVRELTDAAEVEFSGVLSPLTVEVIAGVP